MSSLTKTICVWDCDDDPSLGLDCCFVFWNKTFEVDVRTVSIVDILESHSDQLKGDYLEFIYKLGNSNSFGCSSIQQLKIREHLSYWWMTLLVEKSNWAKSPQISTIVKLMALDLLISESDCKKIVIQSDDQNLVESIKLLCISAKLDFQDLSKKDNRLKVLLHRILRVPIFQWIRAIAWLLREVCFSIPCALMGSKNWSGSDAKYIFVSYLSTVEVKNSCDKDFNSAFWGPLPEFLTKEKVPANWLFLPSRKFNSITTFKAFFKLKKQKGCLHSYTLLSSFFNWRVLFKTIRDWIFVVRNSHKVERELREASGNLWPLIEHDVVRSLCGVELISSLFYLALFESAEGECSQKSKVIYLAENQPWEIGLISSFKSSGHSLIGFAHSTIRYWDLRYYNDTRCYEGQGLNLIPRPDRFAVHGANDRLQMINFGYPSGSISEVESLRYLYLNELIERPVKNETGAKRLLVLGDFLKVDTDFLLSFVRFPEIQKILDKVEVVIKPHPACPLGLKDIEGIDASIKNSELGQLIQSADVVYTLNVSSAAVEAYCLGKHVISARNASKLDMSPLRGVKNVRFVCDVESFKKNLEICLDCNIPVENPNLFRLNPDLLSWRRLLGF